LSGEATGLHILRLSRRTMAAFSLEIQSGRRGSRCEPHYRVRGTVDGRSSRLVTSGGSLCRTRQGHRSEFIGPGQEDGTRLVMLRTAASWSALPISSRCFGVTRPFERSSTI
jgi:hypothetical protein